MIHRGFQFLQIPGPTNVPERILRAMARPTIDHRGPEFQRLISDRGKPHWSIRCLLGTTY